MFDALPKILMRCLKSYQGFMLATLSLKIEATLSFKAVNRHRHQRLHFFVPL
jgi:hypothetical protein